MLRREKGDRGGHILRLAQPFRKTLGNVGRKEALALGDRPHRLQEFVDILQAVIIFAVVAATPEVRRLIGRAR